jgi:hypothetical protein
MKAATINSAANPVPREQKPVTLLKRIGSTTVEVTVHFSSERSERSETMADIVRRMLEREVRDIA